MSFCKINLHFDVGGIRSDPLDLTLKKFYNRLQKYCLALMRQKELKTSPVSLHYFSEKESKKLLSFLPKEVLDVEIPEVVLLTVVPQHEGGNSVFPPHVDEDRIAVINLYLDTHGEQTTFYEYSHGSQIKEKDSFVAKSGEVWLLDVSTPHSVALSFPHTRKAVSFSFIKTPFQKLKNIFKNELQL